MDRRETGEIFYKTPLGHYMYDHLKLYLKRHAIIYMMDKLQNKIIELGKSISDDKTHGIDVGKKEVVLSTIKSEFFDYYCQVQKEE